MLYPSDSSAIWMSLAILPMACQADACGHACGGTAGRPPPPCSSSHLPPVAVANSALMSDQRARFCLADALVCVADTQGIPPVMGAHLLESGAVRSQPGPRTAMCSVARPAAVLLGHLMRNRAQTLALGGH